MDFELTTNEILAIISVQCPDTWVWDEDRAIAIAAQKKLMLWLHEKCYKHDAGLLRLGCPECLRELRKVVE